MLNFVMSQNRLGLLEFLKRCSNLRKAQSELCWLNYSLKIEFHDVPISFKYGYIKFLILCFEMFPVNSIVPNIHSVKNYVFKTCYECFYHIMLFFGECVQE